MKNAYQIGYLCGYIQKQAQDVQTTEGNAPDVYELARERLGQKIDPRDVQTALATKAIREQFGQPITKQDANRERLLGLPGTVADLGKPITRAQVGTMNLLRRAGLHGVAENQMTAGVDEDYAALHAGDARRQALLFGGAALGGAGVGAGVGAAVAGKGKRLKGAAIGGAVGLAASPAALYLAQLIAEKTKSGRQPIA